MKTSHTFFTVSLKLLLKYIIPKLQKIYSMFVNKKFNERKE